MFDESHAFRFPLGIDSSGSVSASGGDEAIRGKIIQILFTAPGERVHQPDFGCGLLNLVFEPNDEILAPAIQFTVGQALSKWLVDELVVDAVNVTAEDEYSIIEVVYTKKNNLQQQAVRIQFK